MTFINRLKKYTIEELIEYISSNNYEEEFIAKKITKSIIVLSEQEELLNKIAIAYKRINEPLELELVLFYLFFPFGFVNSFSDRSDENIERFKRFLFLRKIKEYYVYSIIGLVTYIILGVVIPIIFGLIS